MRPRPAAARRAASRARPRVRRHASRGRLAHVELRRARENDPCRATAAKARNLASTCMSSGYANRSRYVLDFTLRHARTVRRHRRPTGSRAFSQEEDMRRSALFAVLVVAAFPVSAAGRPAAIALQENALGSHRSDDECAQPRDRRRLRADGRRSGSAKRLGLQRLGAHGHRDRRCHERVRRATPVSARPVDLAHLAGPMLAADAGGAWLVGIDEQQGPLLTRVPAGAATYAPMR